MSADEGRMLAFPATAVTDLAVAAPPYLLGGSEAPDDRVQGRILLVRRGYGPRLALFLPVCAGLVCEASGLTSHPAILAREAVVPCMAEVVDVAAMHTADVVRLVPSQRVVQAVWHD